MNRSNCWVFCIFLSISFNLRAQEVPLPVEIQPRPITLEEDTSSLDFNWIKNCNEKVDIWKIQTSEKIKFLDTDSKFVVAPDYKSYEYETKINDSECYERKSRLQCMLTASLNNNSQYRIATYNRTKQYRGFGDLAKKCKSLVEQVNSLPETILAYANTFDPYFSSGLSLECNVISFALVKR